MSSGTLQIPSRECICSLGILLSARDLNVNPPAAERHVVSGWRLGLLFLGNPSASGRATAKPVARATSSCSACDFALFEMRDAAEDGDQLGLAPDSGLREDRGQLAARRGQLDAELLRHDLQGIT